MLVPVHAPRLVPSNLPPPLANANSGSAEDDVLLTAVAPPSDVIALPPSLLEVDALDEPFLLS